MEWLNSKRPYLTNAVIVIELFIFDELKLTSMVKIVFHLLNFYCKVH